MLSWDIANIILGTTLVVIGLMLLFKFIIVRYKREPKITSPHKLAHRRKEIRLLSKLANEIKNNPDEWIPVAYNPSELKDASIINDKKNIAILLKDNDTIAIKVNIKSAAKYRETDEHTLVTQIYGEHVRKFRQQAEEYIDSRGKELTFFEDLLNEKL